MLKILILGGGFGGIRCALDLEKKLKGEAEISLIDRNSYHFFIPSLYEIASAYGIKKDPFAIQLKRTICMPYADIFSGKKINFIQAEIKEINLINQQIKTGGEHVLDYDYLVIALGSDPTDYNVTGVKEYAHQFKTLEDGLFINQKLDDLASQFVNQGRVEPFNFLICGGGFTGIELAAELGCCSKAIKEKCRFKGRCSTITIFEAGPKILPAISEKERRYIKKRLTDLGIILMENSPVEEVGSDFVKLKTGHKLEGDIIVWAGGTKPIPILKSIIGLPSSESGRIKVDNNLQIKGINNVFGIGDIIEFIDSKNQKPIPSLAYIAVDQGKIAARNIYNSINSKKLKQYKPFYSIWIIPIGGKFALARLWGGVLIKGLWGWIVRQLVDIRYLLSIFSVRKALEVYWSEITIFLKND